MFLLGGQERKERGFQLVSLEILLQCSGAGTEASLASEVDRSALQAPLALLGRWLRDFCLACLRDTLPFGQGKNEFYVFLHVASVV